MQNSSKCILSIIIPTRDRPLLLKQCLAALAQQTLREGIEIIVADDGRSGREVILPELGLSIQIVKAAQKGAASARMEAVAVASGSLLGFLDDDAIPDPTWINTILSRRTELESRLLAITGRILPLQTTVLSRARQARYDARQQTAISNGGRCTFFAGGNAAISKRTFNEIGGFDRNMDMMHDGALLSSLEARGGWCEYDHSLVIKHLHVKSVSEAYKNAFRSGGYRMRILGAEGNTIAIRSEALKSVRVFFSPFETDSDIKIANAILNLTHLLGAGTFKLTGGKYPS
jgi:glycosyltransferase involved in cell wall biosynthesis